MKNIKAIWTVLAGLALLSSTLSATVTTSDQEPHSTVQVSIFPPLGTNGRNAGDYTNDFSLNLLVGVSRNERVLTLAGLANIIHDNATGVQLAGLGNLVGGEGRGLQFAGLANVVGDSHKGFQFGGLANVVGDDFKGLQFGGLGNVAGGDFEGLQFGGIANVAGGDFEGLQFGGIANVAGGDFKGLQFGGVGNLTKDVQGIQFGGLFNMSGDVHGVQFGGLFNVARRVCGVQFAGLVNIADHSDYPVGLINIIKDGEMAVGIGYNELGTASLAFRSGGRVLYGILGMGYNHKVAKKEAVTITGGLGAHINIIRWLRVNMEITTESIGIFSNENTTFKSSYAILPTFRIGDHFEIFAGPSINYLQSGEAGMYGIFPENSLWKRETSARLQQLYIGWQAGVQYVF